MIENKLDDVQRTSGRMRNGSVLGPIVRTVFLDTSGISRDPRARDGSRTLGGATEYTPSNDPKRCVATNKLRNSSKLKHWRIKRSCFFHGHTFNAKAEKPENVSEISETNSADCD